MLNIVSLRECENYQYNKVKESIKKSINDLGGFDKYIKKGEVVLLKVNLLMKRKPEEATTTHPNFVKALAELLLEFGVKVIIADSPGGPFNKTMLNGVYAATGMKKISEELPIKLNYNTNFIEVKNENSLILKKLTVIEVLKEVDKVISVSKLKTHGMVRFTGAVKNMFGTVPGILKAEYHFRMPKIDDFCDALIDICMFSNPILSFMDGIIAMEGEGPSSGKPKHVGVVISSNSPYHLDVIATRVIGINPYKVPTIKRCVQRGLIDEFFKDIKIVGENIDKFVKKDFIVPEIRSLELIQNNVPKVVKKIINYLFQPKPIFNHKNCISCNICKDNCPPKVIDMINNYPEVNLDSCIRCFCCHELCPQKTIYIKRPLLMKLISKI